MDEVNLAMLLVRVVVGVTLAMHGVQKVRGGLDGVARWFDGMGMRPGRLHARFAAFGEIAAGLCLATGFLTTFAGLGFVGLMSVAGWTDHRDKGFAMLGPGAWSVDHAIGIDDALDGYVGLLVAAGGGLAAAVGLLVVFYRPPAATD